MNPDRCRGAALTARPVVGRAWRGCCERAAVAYAATAATVDPIIAAMAGARPVVLVDAPMGTPDAIAALRRAGAELLLLAPDAMSATVRAALSAGADAIITVADPIAEAEAALRQLLDAGSYASPTGARLLLRDRPPEASGAIADVRLSPRERDVLLAMVDGMTAKATARRLGVALKTIEAHRTRIFTRLGVRNQTEAVTRALTEPWLFEGSRSS